MKTTAASAWPAFCWVASSLLACNLITRGLAPAPTPTQVPTAAPGTAGAPPPFKLALQRIDPLPKKCSASPFGLPSQRIEEVAYQPTGFCFNGEIDTFEQGGRLYVVQSLGTEAAFFITDVSDPRRPAVVGAWQWNDFPYTADVKTFKQGSRRFLALSLEPQESRLCGTAIVEVTDPARPVLVGNFRGGNTGAPDDWCDTHTTEISADAQGDGAFIYVSALDTADLRVLDVRGLPVVREINHYRLAGANTNDTFVHDTTLVRGRVYVAYWSGGVLIFDRAQLESGAQPRPLNPPGSIAPAGLQIHHSFPTRDDGFLFVEDEVNYDGQLSQLRLYDIRDLSAPREVLSVSLDKPYSSPHNLLVDGDLLYVGWYTDGVRVFRYDVGQPDRPVVTPYAFKVTRPAKTKGVFGSDLYDSIYGVRLHACQIQGGDRTCIYASDLTRGLLILALHP
jgi:hypothetical protein